MAKLHIIKSSFTGGEFSPLLEGRVDLQQYGNAVKELSNFIIMPQGGVTRRGGWHYVTDTKIHSQQSRLIPFEYSSLQSYILEFGNHYIRFCMNGLQIEGGTGANFVNNGEFATDILSWTEVMTIVKNGKFPDDILDWTNKSSGNSSISWNSSLKRVSLATGSSGYAGIEQEIEVEPDTTYKVRLDAYDHNVRVKIGTTSGGSDAGSSLIGPGDCWYTFSAPVGYTKLYLQFYNESASTTQTLDNIRVYPFDTPGTITWNSGTQSMKLTAVQNGAIGTEQAIVTEAGKTYFLTFDVGTKNLRVRIGTRTQKDDIMPDQTFEPDVDNELQFVAESSTTYIQFYNDNVGSSYLDNVVCQAAGPYEVESPYAEEDLPDIAFAQSADKLYLVHPYVPPQKLTRLAHNSWELDEISFTDGPWKDEVTTPTITPSATTGDITLTASASLFYSNHVGGYWRLKHSSTWGYVRITEYTDPTHVNATVITTLGGTGASSAQREGSWSDYSGYPRAITFHEDRLIYAGTGLQPQTFWGSKVGAYSDFTPGVLDADPYYYTLGAGAVDMIMWLASGKYLFIGTRGSEFVVKGGTDTPITPTAVDIKSECRFGSSAVQCLRVAHAIIFVQTAGRKVRELAYDWQSDSYSAPDLTLLAEHLFLDGIWEMAYQQEPNSILWVATNTKQLIACTYERTQSIVGWHQHPTDGDVESIAVVSSAETLDDVLYAIVKRTVNGETKRFIEYMEGANYTDCCLNYSGSPTQKVTGMDHLIGRTVSILGDGCVYPPAVVAEDGSVTLDGPAASEIEVGLPFTSRIITLRPEVNTAVGTSQAIVKHWSKVTLRLFETIGATINGEQMEFRTPDDPMDESLSVFTGDKTVANLGRSKEAQVTVEQTQPLPITVVALIGVLDVGD